ncbi:hypothetical protein QZM93_25260 [Burkholderia cepacia]|uniref:hypothetical protein n=1 Tax=Burkholderia cepacia TaxID=292 RepID=UPI0011AD6754|nr:hypothetical protein [Burkholderia cepacia]MDN7891926.1 hypothetical protein [Burkholderia cepacia]
MVSKEDRATHSDPVRFVASRTLAKTVEVKTSHLVLISYPVEAANMTLEATAGQRNAGAGNKLATVQPGVRSSQPLGANGVGIGVLRHIGSGICQASAR